MIGTTFFFLPYGGDEFILIVHPSEDREMETMLNDIRAEIYGRCESEKKPYRISIGIGVDELDRNEPDPFAKCMKRADDKMYRNKKSVKQAAV